MLTKLPVKGDSEPVQFYLNVTFGRHNSSLGFKYYQDYCVDGVRSNLLVIRPAVSDLKVEKITPKMWNNRMVITGSGYTTDDIKSAPVHWGMYDVGSVMLAVARHAKKLNDPLGWISLPHKSEIDRIFRIHTKVKTIKIVRYATAGDWVGE